MIFKTREEWLRQAVNIIGRKLQKEHNISLPKVRISCGFTGSTLRSSQHKVLGACWVPNAASDGIGQIFVSPIIDDTKLVLGVIVHELVHALTPGAGHGKDFRKTALKLGLEGKMTSALPGKPLQRRLNRLNAALGDYPHSKLNLKDSPVKKQGTRMIKCKCSTCGYTARTSRHWINESGAPICPCNNEIMKVEVKNGRLIQTR